MINAKWLFQNYLRLLAIKKYLESESAYWAMVSFQEEKEEIESRMLAQPELGMTTYRSSHGSKTEHIALALEEKRINQQKEQIKRNQSVQKQCNFLLSLYEAVMLSLKPKEAWLIDKIYNQGLSLSRICELPDCPFGPCDRSTLCRQRQKIEQKTNEFIKAYVPEEVDICQLKKYSDDLKT